MSTVLKVGVRQFRAQLPEYLLTSLPVAITRHGEIIGYYIPTHHNEKTTKKNTLKKAAMSLEKLLTFHGLTPEDLLSEFHALREERI